MQNQEIENNFNSYMDAQYDVELEKGYPFDLEDMRQAYYHAWVSSISFFFGSRVGTAKRREEEKLEG